MGLLAKEPPIFPASNPKQVPFSSAANTNSQAGTLGPQMKSPPAANPSSNPTAAQMPTMEQLQQYQQLQQQLFQSQLLAMNNGMYPMFSYGFPPVLNYQLYLEQLKNNPYAAMQNMQNMQGLHSTMGMMGQGGQMSQGEYIPLSKPPISRGAQQSFQSTENKKEQVQPQPQKHVQPTVTQGTPKIVQTATSHTPQTATEGELEMQKISDMIIQPIDFKRKSCYHVAIAYNMHFARLKEKGLFNSVNSEESYLQLDPTFPAKKIRQRRNSAQVPTGVDNPQAPNQTSTG